MGTKVKSVDEHKSSSDSQSPSPEKRDPRDESYYTAPEPDVSMEEERHRVDETRAQDEEKVTGDRKHKRREDRLRKDKVDEHESKREDKDEDKSVKMDKQEDDDEAPAEKKRAVSPSKLTSARKISISSRRKSDKNDSPASIEAKSDQPRKRKWGSGKSTSTKKPTLSISTESFKGIIPDIKTSQLEAIIDLTPEEERMSDSDENHRSPPSPEEIPIRRTVTQVVPAAKEESVEEKDEETQEREEDGKSKEDVENEEPADSMDVGDEKEEKVVMASPPKVIRRQLSNLPVDDPVVTRHSHSPARMPVSNIVHVMNLVRPFTINQLKDLLSRSGSILEDGFWIDKIKSHCFVTYSSEEEAIKTRDALHSTKWPSSNPKNLIVEFGTQGEIDRLRGVAVARPEVKVKITTPPPPRERRDSVRERDREKARKEREREREREKDRNKTRDRSDSRETRRKDRQKEERKVKVEPEEPPAKLLDDLFRKTKATPCIYWLPLTEEQMVVKDKDRKKVVAEAKQETERLEKERQERLAERRRADRQSRSRDRDRDRDRDRNRRRR